MFTFLQKSVLYVSLKNTIPACVCVMVTFSVNLTMCLVVCVCGAWGWMEYFSCGVFSRSACWVEDGLWSRAIQGRHEHYLVLILAVHFKRAASHLQKYIGYSIYYYSIKDNRIPVSAYKPLMDYEICLPFNYHHLIDSCAEMSFVKKRDNFGILAKHKD